MALDIRFKGIINTLANIAADKFAGRLAWATDLARLIWYYDGTNYGTMARRDVLETFSQGIQDSTITNGQALVAGPSGRIQSQDAATFRATIGAESQHDYNLDDYGAAGDGVTNDYPAWLLAVADITAAGGGRLIVGNKTYAMDPGGDNFLSLPANASIFGSGWDSVLSLTASASGRGALRPYTGSPCYTTIADLAIIGPEGARSASAGACGIYASGCTNLQIRNVRIFGVSGAGINMKNGQDILVDGCYVHSTQADGIHMPNNCERIQVTNCRVHDTGDDGISVVGYRDSGASPIPENILISGNIVTNGHSRGITVVGGRRVTISGNVIENCMAAGIYCVSESSYDTWEVDDILISENTINRIGREYFDGFTGQIFSFVIRVAGRTSYRAQNVQIINNVILDSCGRNNTSGSAETGTNYVYATSCDALAVRGNTFLGRESLESTASVLATRFAYLFDCTDIQICENHMEGCRNQAIYFDSDCDKNARVSGNTFDDVSLNVASPVIESASGNIRLCATENIVRNPIGTPTFFIRFTAAIVNTKSFFIYGNDVGSLANSGLSAAYHVREMIIQPLPITNSAPGVVTVGPSGAMRSFGFDGSTQVEELFYHVDLQHDYIPNTDIIPHVHWLPSTSGAGNVVWKWDYQWVETGGTFGAPTTAACPAVAAGGTAWVDKRSEVTVDGSGHTYNSRLLLRLYRDPADVGDTYAADAVLSSVGVHYLANTLQPG